MRKLTLAVFLITIFAMALTGCGGAKVTEKVEVQPPRPATEIDEQLFDAVNAGDLDGVKASLKAEAYVTAQAYKGVTPLHVAAYSGYTEIAAFLLDQGADVNAQDDEGSTPLLDAAYGGHTETAALLLDRGADVNARNKYGMTPLSMAVDLHRTETQELLRQHGGVE
jgi:ankyrin repeat protein